MICLFKGPLILAMIYRALMQYVKLQASLILFSRIGCKIVYLKMISTVLKNILLRSYFICDVIKQNESEF